MKPSTDKRLSKLFKKQAKDVKYFVERWFGPKCKNFNEDCECCKRWALAKKLTENPFDDKNPNSI